MFFLKILYKHYVDSMGCTATVARKHYLDSTTHRPSYTPHANRGKADHKRRAPGPPPLVTAHDLHPRSVSSTDSRTIHGSEPLATWAPAPPSAAAHEGDPHDSAFGHP